MNILVTTLGMSWQIVPELLGFTNPEQYDFFKGNESVGLLRKKYAISPVDACWIITVESQLDIEKLAAWADHWKINLKIAVCKGIKEFANQQEIELMRSFIYRVVLNASASIGVGEKLYLSLSGGRKTMSADMQEAGNLFGCDAMLHIVDIDREVMQKIKCDTLLGEPGKYARQFMPVMVNEKTEPSVVVSAGETRITHAAYPFAFAERQIIRYDEDRTLEQAIQERKKQSFQLYANFYASMSDNTKGRDIFRKLYFLHPDIIRKLKEIKIGDNGNRERDMGILQAFPKADLHSHLGGVLRADEIIQTALTENFYIQHLLETRDDLREWQTDIQVAVSNHRIEELEDMKTALFDLKKTDFSLFYDKLLILITAFQADPPLFDRLIYGTHKDNFYGIGIDAYQKLGDFQGSSLLQTQNTITKAAELYAANLIRDKVRYVEIRCSPYKYTRKGLSEAEVVNALMDVFDAHQNKIEYRLICIIGREVGFSEIKQSIVKIEKLLSINKRFSVKLAGIDLAGNEGKAQPKELRELFMPFLEKCIHITIHAGETEPVDNVWQAVYHLSADRIGHGLTLLDNHDLMARFVDKNIGVELCPSSNNQIVGYERSEKSYPLKQYMEAGLKVTINTDNTGISRTSCSQEFYKASSLCQGLSLWDCLVLIRNSLNAAFLDNQTKTTLLRSFEDELYDWCIEHISALSG